MNPTGKILAFLKRLPGNLLWFAFAPKDWDPELEDFEVKMEEGWVMQENKSETRIDRE